MAKVYIFSGAGLSAASGIPTFRDANGLWHNHDIDKVCNIKTWQENYDLVHEFYNQRRVEMASVKPNLAHQAIAELQQDFDVVNITTNVDDLLEQAGVTGVTHLHGIITEMKNMDTGEVCHVGNEEFPYENVANFKPNVVFFGEHAPEYEGILNSPITPEDIVVFIGMSFEVVPIEMCIPWGITPKIVINLNPKPSDNPMVDYDVVETAEAGFYLVKEIIEANMEKRSDV